MGTAGSWIFRARRLGRHFQWSASPFFSLFNKYLLSTSIEPGIVLGTGDPAVKKTIIPVLVLLKF